ncbi:glycoside hydrolase [Aspergillus steynii IBT 23096]|uniref:beta-glucosidase n=1 Tax=Aspergillus steynii IBT 23096 TaxID=1392250 RepID=A0A2I2GK57_9EURO|nr:glycoside hydrolase [Aspergillus steynii IBT 23096]PLB53260.1 glycoside hydrolase [Aspergillus steynii IBT 23096]
MCDPTSPVIDHLLNALTLEEKVSLLAGQNMWETAAIDRLNIPALRMTDGPAGARGSKWNYGSPTTFIPCGISLAATWDLDMIERIGTVLGHETQRQGCKVLLAPTMNLSRSPLGGRNFEGYGEDPFLVGSISRAIIRGIQRNGVGACMKHFILNDTETRRFNVDQKVDERTLREVYMKPFVMALDADPWTAMVSYPLINGLHADENPAILPQLLRKELQFNRLVMSDWGGCNSTVESLIATTDLEMPGPPVRRGERLIKAIKDGHIDELQHVNPSVVRVLQLLEKAHLLPSLPENKDCSTSLPSTEESSMDTPALQKIARETAQGGLVLLKNDDILPLQPSSIKKVAIIGPNARRPTAGGSGSAAVNPLYITTPEECLKEALEATNPNIEVGYEQGLPFTIRPPLLGDSVTVAGSSQQGVQVDFYAGHAFEGPVESTSIWPNSLVYMMSDGDVPPSLKGKPYCYRVTGNIVVHTAGQYTLSVGNTGKAKVFIDDELVIDNTEWTKVAPSNGFLGCSSPDAIVELTLASNRPYALRVDNVATLPPLEKCDNTLFPNVSGLRLGLALHEDEQAMFDRAVQAAGDSDVALLVIGHNKDSEGEGGDRKSLNLPGRMDELVKAVCARNANTVVIIQAASAVSMDWADDPAAIVLSWYQGQENGNALADVLLGACNFSGKTPITFPRRLIDHGSSEWHPAEAEQDRSVIGEKVLVGYRSFEEQGIEPLWPFGFGLSYTSFVLSNIRLENSIIKASADSKLTVCASVTNIGILDGHEVLQIYLSPSSIIRSMGLVSYPKTLAGFSKVWVQAGETRDVEIEVQGDELRWYDEETSQWRIDPGGYTCYVGTSVTDIDAQLSFEMQ